MTASDPLLYALLAIIGARQLVRSFGRGMSRLLSTLARTGIEALLLLPVLLTPSNWPFLVLMILLLNAVDHLLPMRLRDENAERSLSLLVILVVVVAVIGTRDIIPGFNGAAAAVAGFLRVHNSAIGAITAADFHRLLVIVAGVLIAGVEVNCLVALALKGARLMPPAAPPGAGAAEGARSVEISRGRMIGILERSIVFFLTVTGNLTAIGLILAAKAIARFKELDDRDFAEYVLIGTLLSITMAVAVALVLKA